MSSFDSDRWRSELLNFRNSLDSYKMPLPDVCAYEYTHAITHIIKGYHHTPSDQANCMKRACDHVLRAHLDYLKIIIKHIHNHLKANHPTNADFLNFLKDKISARLKELEGIGGQHEDTIERFRSIINKYLPPDLSVHAPPEWKTLPGYLQEGEVLQGSTLEKERRPTQEQYPLLTQWARLESIITSLDASKFYDISYNLLCSYTKYVDMSEDLKEQIADIKHGIMELALTLDHEHKLQQALDRNTVYANTIGPALLDLENPDEDKQAEAIRAITNNIDNIFPLIEHFLGLS